MNNIEFIRDQYYNNLSKYLNEDKNSRFRETLLDSVNYYRRKLDEAYAELDQDFESEQLATFVRDSFEKTRAEMKDKNYNFLNALSTNTTTGNGGADILPKTTANEVITEPYIKNKLRNYIRISKQSNLEIPKLAFATSDDSFIEDEETAKELTITGNTVKFGMFKSKMFVDISETVLLGSNIQLSNYINEALNNAMQAKELKQLFGTTLSTTEDHMSFYQKDGANYTIKEVKAASKILAIKKAIADLGEDFRENAKIIMSYADYLEIVEALANGNLTLYNAQPNQILGKQVIFIDSAVIPIVGDLDYLQINYYPETISDSDKNIKTGVNTFAVTAWYDIQFRLRSAFRLAAVK